MLFSHENPLELAIPEATVHLWHDIPLPDSLSVLFEGLLAQTPWQEEDIVVFGKRYKQPRLLAWYGDPGTAYTYSGVLHIPQPWTPLLTQLRKQVEATVGHQFNSVLLNLYRDHRDSMGLHADDEPELGAEPVIASLSFGQSRTFIFKHKRDKSLARVKVPLPAGSLLLMRGQTQQNWKHGIDKERQPCGPRINLTFRTIHQREKATMT